MNRHRLTALVTAGAVLAGVVGVLSGSVGMMRMTRTWADPGSAVSVVEVLVAKGGPAPRPVKVTPARPAKPVTPAKPAPSGSGKGGKVVTPKGRTWS